MTDKETQTPEPTEHLPATHSSTAAAPTSLIRSFQGTRAGRLLKRLPGSELAQSQLERLEHRVLSELKYRLKSIDDSTPPNAHNSLPTPRQSDGQRPGDKLRNLLERSVDQSREAAAAEFFNNILDQLVPDETRILSALADNSSYPIVHVLVSSRLGLGSHIAVEHISSVGKNCGVKAQALTADYIHHLVRIGLAYVDNEAINDQTAYQMLESETAVRKAMDAAKANGQRAQLVKRTLKMSDSGKRFWEACRLSIDDM